MKYRIEKIRRKLQRGLALTSLVFLTTACQDTDTSSSESLLDIPDSVKISKALINSSLSSSLTINGTHVDSTITQDSSGFYISATILKSQLNSGALENDMELNILYPCGQNGVLLSLASVIRTFSYTGSDIGVSYTSDNEPDSDNDGITNHDECRDGSLAYDSSSPNPPVVAPTTGSVLFSIGIASNRFYDSDTNDEFYLTGAVQTLNDNLSQAQTISGSSETTGYASARTDEADWYYIGGSGSGNISLLVANTDVDLDLKVYDSNAGLIGSSLGLAGAVESIVGVPLPVYIEVSAISNDSSGHGSRYKLVTTFSGQASMASTAVSRFRLNLIDPITGTTLWEGGKYDDAFIVNGNLNNTQVRLSDVPTGNYDFRIHSKIDKDDANFDSAYDMGVVGIGSVTVTGGQELFRTVVMD